jgi:hypothetical protein
MLTNRKRQTNLPLFLFEQQMCYNETLLRCIYHVFSVTIGFREINLYNVLRLGVVRVLGEGFVGKTNAYLETRTPFY